MRDAADDTSPAGGRLRRVSASAVAGLLFAGVFVLRLAIEDPSQAITLLYALPIALLATERGSRWGVGAATLALGLFTVWDLTSSAETDHTVFEYLTHAAVFFVVGGLVGALADRLRRVSAASARFWELSTDLLGTAGFDGYFKRVNPAWVRTLGWTAEELCSQPFVEFLHPDDRERTAAEAASLTGVGYETLVFENRYRCKDGSYRTILWGARSVPEEGLIYATGTDVTDFNRAQEELRNSERFLDSVLENIPNLVFVKDAADMRFVRFNRAGEELFGCSRDDLLGKSCSDLFPKQQADELGQTDREALASDVVVDIPEETIETPGNGARVFHTRKVAIRDEHGEPRYLLGIAADITERKLAERAAAAAQAEAERANKAKSEFLSRMSHELRTPLNAVIGFGQLLQLDDLDARQDEAVEQILNAGRHLLELINEVLDISQIETGTMSMSVEPVHVAGMLAETLSLIGPLADKANVRLTADPSRYVDLYVLADQQRLKQVLINLLSNAVKYNRPGGKVTVRCARLAAGRIEVTVQDTGHGMSADQLQRLFEPFDRLGAECTDVEGTGLGLSLSRGLVHAMGGTISAESQPGVGSTLRVQLAATQQPGDHATEAAAIAAIAATAAERPPQDGCTIVYIEDNLSNLKLVERLLARLPDVRLMSAMDGKQGIDLVCEHQPDLILLDLHLPDMHGRDVLKQLKHDPATAAIPVAVLSADATPTQVKRLRAAGAADYLTKPIDVKSLLDTVRQHRASAHLARERSE